MRNDCRYWTHRDTQTPLVICLIAMDRRDTSASLYSGLVSFCSVPVPHVEATLIDQVAFFRRGGWWW